MKVIPLISLPRFSQFKTITVDLKLEIALHSAPSFHLIIRCSTKRQAGAPLAAHPSSASPPCFTQFPHPVSGLPGAASSDLSTCRCLIVCHYPTPTSTPPPSHPSLQHPTQVLFPTPEGKTQNVSLHSNLPSVINFFTTLFQTICVQSFYFLTLPLLQKNVFSFLLPKPEANHILLIPASEARPWQHCYA